MLGEAGEREEAISEYRAAIRLKPDYASAHFNLAVALGETAPVEELIQEFREVLRVDPNHRIAFDNLLHLQHYDPATAARKLFADHRAWAQRFEQPVLANSKPPENDRAPDRRLRIGYVSRDFRTHSVSFFIEPILAAHDRSKFEVFCYADETVSDDTTERLRALADVWRDTTRLTDEQLADQVRTDQIDILIDLAGHTEGNRLMTFARRPALVQATWLGYPDTTGMSAIDFRITDALADPDGADAMATEKLLRLPSGWCYRPPDESPEPIRVDDGSGVTFGCFNTIAKVNAPLVSVWADVLKSVKNSRMILKSSGLERGDVCERVLGMFRAVGIGADRLELLGATPSLQEHLALYQRVDVALDTFPYHGTTTSCEAMWMGVPLVTLAGHTHASRVGVSLQSHAGIKPHVASNRSEYVSLARRAAEGSGVDEMRWDARKQMSMSPLLEPTALTRALESALSSAALSVHHR